MAKTILPKGNLVDEWMDGNTHIMFYDDAYAGKSQDEIQQVLDKITQTALMCVFAARAEGVDI